MRLDRFFRRARNQRGVSLIEVLSSVSIFGVLASGAAVGTISTVRTNTTSRMTAAASALIQDRVEQFRALDPVVSPADFTAGTHYDAGNPMTAIGGAGGKFSRFWTVTRNSPRAGLAEIRINVTWNDGYPRSLQSVTYVCLTAKCA